MPHRFALFGNPVSHSLGPRLLSAYAATLEREVDYKLQLVEPGGFAEAARAFFDAGGVGLNITVPFKSDAGAYIKALSRPPSGAWSSRFVEFARASGCVNLLMRAADGAILPCNTDHFGAVAGLRHLLNGELTIDGRLDALRGRSMLVLGAGGAARNVLVPDEEIWDLDQLSELVVASRSPAAWLARLPNAELSDYASLRDRRFDLIINATSAGHAGETPPLPDGALAEGGYCYDLSYAAAARPFMRRARELGADPAHIADGLSMLVMQALPVMPIWLESAGETPPPSLSRRLLETARRLLAELPEEAGE